MNELYNIKVEFNKDEYVDNELEITKKSVEKLKNYLDTTNYEKVLLWFKEYQNYLKTFNDFHLIHGDLWYENYIINDNNELVGIVDFEGSGMGDPAYDFAALYYLGDNFINLVLKNYKYTNNDLKRRIEMLIRAREICDFVDTLENYPEEINGQIDKIKKVL